LGQQLYAVGGETPAVRVRQKTYAINLMFTTLSATLVSQVTPILINPSSANLGAKVAFVFFAPSLFICIYLHFGFPEMKGRSYLELEEMFQSESPLGNSRATILISMSIHCMSMRKRSMWCTTTELFNLLGSC